MNNTNTIHWLQSLGELAHVDSGHIQSLAREYQIDGAVVRALQAGDHQALAEFLGARKTVVAFLVPSREDDAEEDTPAEVPDSDPVEDSPQDQLAANQR